MMAGDLAGFCTDIVTPMLEGFLRGVQLVRLLHIMHMKVCLVRYIEWYVNMDVNIQYMLMI